jgi:type VI secretion system protein ImpC
MPKESLRNKLDRVRPPRVELTYDVERGDAVEQREVPFVIGVMGNYSGNPERPRPRELCFRPIDFDNFDSVMAELVPCLRLSIAGLSEQQIKLTFRTLGDFEPEGLIRQVPSLQSLRESTDPEDAMRLSRLLDRILHETQFQMLESAWRGLWYLLSRTETSSQLIIKLLDVTKRDLLRDLSRAVEFDQSRLFKAVYEVPYGELAPVPFGLLIGNYEFGPYPEDIETLDKVSEIAAACHAPFIAGALPEFFSIPTFRDLSSPRDLHRIFDSTEYARWKSFRGSEDARYVGLTLPRILLRSPHGMRPELPTDFQHTEEILGPQSLVWGNAAFAFAVCVATAFARYGWCGAIRGMEAGGMVEGLPTWVYEAEDKEVIRSGVEVMITDRREKEISDLGFLPLVDQRSTDAAVFFSASSCCMPKLYDSDVANANSRLTTQLQYVLTASRFMHYFKAITRDLNGSYHVRSELENFLNRWVLRYVLSDDQASPAIRSQRPLREARIDLLDDPSKPGAYRVVAFLRPYYQLEELSVSLRIVGRIP